MSQSQPEILTVEVAAVGQSRDELAASLHAAAAAVEAGAERFARGSPFARTTIRVRQWRDALPLEGEIVASLPCPPLPIEFR